MQDLVDHLEASGRPGRTVCFVEPKYAGYGPDEQGELARYVHAHFGVEVCHADPAELGVDGDEVTYQGRAIDLIYRDYAVQDLLDLEAEGVDVRPMQQAFATNRVVSSIDAELDQKSCWEVLGDPLLARRHFSSEDRAFFRRHLPWTRVLRPGISTLPDGSRGDLVEYVLHARQELVLKPNRGYGGTGIAVGPVTAAAEWKALVAAALAPDGERWVAQRGIPLPVCQFPTMSADGRGSTPSPSTSYTASRPARTASRPWGARPRPRSSTSPSAAACACSSWATRPAESCKPPRRSTWGSQPATSTRPRERRTSGQRCRPVVGNEKHSEAPKPEDQSRDGVAAGRSSGGGSISESAAQFKCLPDPESLSAGSSVSEWR
jgi:hypothetical protein